MVKDEKTSIKCSQITTSLNKAHECSQRARVDFQAFPLT